MSVSSDYNERQCALNTNYSFIVQAPAGSGKTELLTQRYLALLAKAHAPEEIIAITFTRKAAAEMCARIVEALQKAQQDDTSNSAHKEQRHILAKAVLEQDRIKNWHLLANPNRLRIQTIDAFCASIVRQMPILSRLGADADIAADPWSLYQQASREVMNGLEVKAQWTAPLIRLLIHLDNDYLKVENLLSDMLAKRDQWLPYIAGRHSQQNVRFLLEEGLKHANDTTLSKILTALPFSLLAEIHALAGFAIQQVNVNSSNTLLQLKNSFSEQIIEQICLINKQERAADQTIKNYYLALKQWLLTQDGQWRKRVTKEEGFFSASDAKNAEEKKYFLLMKNRMQALLEELAQYAEFRRLLLDLSALPNENYSENQWEILTALFALLPILVAQLKLLFQEQGVVDYIEIAQSAALALGTSQSPTDLALALDYTIQHILVDEFQDTAVAQFRLLEQLTAGWQEGDGRTLFLVGDPMQSIYRFRKAEVGLFLQVMEHGIGNVQVKPLILSVNFRSEQPIVDWVNHTFKALMPAQVDITAGAVPYVASQAHKSDANTGNVKFYALESVASHAMRIVTIINQTLAADPHNHIAILVRARSHLFAILPILQQANISYRAVEIEALAERAVIQDLLALTRALLHPADRIAWLAILRAPWCGLTLADLYALVGHDLSSTILERLRVWQKERFALSSHFDREKILERFIAIIETSLQDRRRMQLARWIEGVWLALGGPACLESEIELADAQAFFGLLDTCQIGEDIADFSKLAKRLNTLYANAKADQDICVEVMTIHKAKGLEFDTVLLPGLERMLPSDDPQLLLCMERPTEDGYTHLLLAPIKSSIEEEDIIYNYLRLEEKKRADYEVMRLLYVAATRAKKHLHLLSVLQQSAESALKNPPKNSLLAQLWPLMSHHFLEAFKNNQQQGSQQEIIAITQNVPQFKRLVNSWQLPATPAGFIPEFQVKINIDKQPNKQYSTFSLTREHLKQVGIVVHRLLQQISLDGLAKWEISQLANKQPIFRCLLQQLGVTGTSLANCANSVEKALSNMLGDPRGRWLFNPCHQEAQAEYPLACKREDGYQQIIIDRTFIDEKGIRWIIDYKTTGCEDENIEAFVDNEMSKHRLQLEEYASIIKNIDSRPIRLGLYFPLLAAWREWEYITR
jgi:ATP-dependent exoDNAse (exonuclease V) beta subunit